MKCWLGDVRVPFIRDSAIDVSFREYGHIPPQKLEIIPDEASAAALLEWEMMKRGWPL